MIKQFFTKEILMGVLRHVMTTGGGLLIAKGLASKDQVSTIGDALQSPQVWGAIMAFIAIVKSIAHKQDVAKALATTTAQVQASALAAAGNVAAKTALVLLCLGLTSSAMASTNTVTGPFPGHGIDPLPEPTPTTFTLPLLTLGVSSNTVTTVNDVASWVSPELPFLTNHNITLDVAPVYGQKRFGELAALRVPLTTNVLSSSIGIGEAYAGGTFFIAPVSASIGTTFTIPIINRPIYTFAEEGLSLAPGSLSLGSQTVVGGVTSFDLNSQLQLNLEGGLLKITQLQGNDYFFGAGLVWHPKKW